MKALCLFLILIQVMMMLKKGSLTIRAEKGILNRDTDIIIKMDPYIIFDDGKHQFKTKVHRGGGINPIWNDEFYINYATPFLVFWVFDEDQFYDDFIGKGSFILPDECNVGCLFRQDVPIYYEVQEVGLIYLNFQFTVI